MDTIITLVLRHRVEVTVTVVVAAAASVYAYYKKKFSFWSNQGITGPKPKLFVGNSFDVFLRPILQTDPEDIKKYGRVYGMYQGTNPMLVVSDPKIIRDVLVKEFNVFPNRMNMRTSHRMTELFLPQVNGEEWKRQRSIMSPTFSSGKMRYMFDLMASCCDSLESNLRKLAASKSDIDIKNLMGCYTMDVIAKCCFATETNCHQDPDSVWMKNASVFFTFDPIKLVSSLFLPPYLRKKLKLTPNNILVLEFFQHASEAIIRKRRQESAADSKARGRDFLDIMLEAGRDVSSDFNVPDLVKNDETETEGHHVNQQHETSKTDSVITNLKKSKKNQLTDDEIAANSILFFAAGYETTGSLLTYSAYALAMNPQAQEKLHQEVVAKCVNSETGFDYDTISSLKYLDAFISEVLRFYTPVVRHQRTSVADYWMEIDDGKKIFVPKGSVIVIPADAIHHDSEFYEEPESFDPDRFMPENSSKLIPYTYLPFGSGPRNCIGMRFALIEAKLALARIVSKFKFNPCPKTEIPIDFSCLIFLRQSKSVTLLAEER